MNRPSRKTHTTPRDPDSPPPWAQRLAYTGLALLAALQLRRWFPDDQWQAAWWILATTRPQRGDCDTTQAEIARLAGVSLKTVKRTEATVAALGLVNPARWWQDRQGLRVRPDRSRRQAGHHDRHRRRLWWHPRFLVLIRPAALTTSERRRILAFLRLDIEAHIAGLAASNPGPLAAVLQGVRGGPRPFRRPGLQGKTTSHLIAERRVNGGTQTPRKPKPAPDQAQRRTPLHLKGLPKSPGTSPFGRDKNLLPQSPAEASFPNGHEARASSPPAPAGQHGTATPPPASPTSLRSVPAASGLASGEAPANTPPASGGRGEDRTTPTDRSPDGADADPLRDLAARAALLHRFESDDGAALRHDLHRLHDLRPLDPLTETWTRLLLSPITAALGCTNEDADFLARHFIERLRDERRRAPHGPPPVPRVVGTDTAGQSWVLEWQQPAPPPGRSGTHL